MRIRPLELLSTFLVVLRGHVDDYMPGDCQRACKLGVSIVNEEEKEGKRFPPRETFLCCRAKDIRASGWVEMVSGSDWTLIHEPKGAPAMTGARHARIT